MDLDLLRSINDFNLYVWQGGIGESIQLSSFSLDLA